MSRAPWRLALLVAVLLCTFARAGTDQPIELAVDASEAPRKIIHAKLVIPTTPGEVTLYYPKWIPGEHGPNGPITDLVGLKMSAAGKPVTWKRDDADMFAFHCDVPVGATALEVALDFVSPPANASGFSSSASITPKLATLNWNQFVLYPKGKTMQEVEFQPSLRVPDGWKVATPLLIDTQSGSETRFNKVTLETLIDSTVLTGVYFREIKIGPADGPPHYLDLACDSPAGLDIPDEVKKHFDRLVAETGALFGARHYRSYRFLVALSDYVSHFGEEHHECTDIRGPERGLVDESLRTGFIGVFPHEFVHSWNGKFRRPADMITRDLQEPERTRLLWVYEGLTQYLGTILNARAGFWTPEQLRDALALTVQQQTSQRGRTWRPLDDTAAAAQLLYGARRDWFSWRRGVDFYDEGTLLWLEVDTRIRQLTRGERSIDDFCKRFHGGESGPPGVKGYTLDDIVADLNAVAPFDWKGLLTRRVSLPAEGPPLDGLHRSGWRLVFTDKASDYQQNAETVGKGLDLTASLGLSVSSEGGISDIVRGGPADGATIGPGMKVVAVNGRKFSTQVLRDAVAATKKGQKLEFLVENGEYIRPHPLDYAGGERYPHLEREHAQKDLLDEIIKPQARK